MEYLFLRRKKTRYTSVRQKTLLYRAASRRWEKEFALRTMGHRTKRFFQWSGKMDKRF